MTTLSYERLAGKGLAAGAFLLAAAVALGVFFHEGLAYMLSDWRQEEYGYAYLIPPITAWLIWQRREKLAAVGHAPSWWGVGVIGLGLLLGVLGDLGTLYVIIQYAFIVTIFGLALTLVGWKGLGVIAAPLLYLFFMVPLPDFLYQGLSGKLQLVSSELGVAFIRLFGLPVFLEGNVIDLGNYQLQVAEACSGLRYLFPLLSFGYLCALLYKGPWQHRVVLVLSPLPITILVNSTRIGLIGVLVHHWGIGQAEGFMHLFEGWIIFLAAVAILFAEMWLMARLGGARGGLGDVLDIDSLWPRRQAGSPPPLRISAPICAGGGLILAAALGALALPPRPEIIPESRNLALFPLAIGGWQGHPVALDQKYITALRFDDYVMADYQRPSDNAHVNFYIAYYASQRKGVSAHSPQTCIPGGGWEVSGLSSILVDGAGTSSPGGIGAEGLEVNRVVISKGPDKQLVYYWFDQRGRRMTSEYHVKLMLLWDALTRRRTDGALVRLVTPVGPTEDLAAADRRLGDFLRAVYPKVEAFVPI